ncbi:hypothetical protein PC111_g17577 [Phytophthora cactorum]|nr:hypothetical protein PC111_g17577 [Phytophthora cactorum]KAG2884164.1 hypothetical protein PC114_g20246 [Phytophthora cactorum]KAG3179287.1 hypothetical protein C6341_g7540 [Phytophthora cactorum]
MEGDKRQEGGVAAGKTGKDAAHAVDAGVPQKTEAADGVGWTTVMHKPGRKNDDKKQQEGQMEADREARKGETAASPRKAKSERKTRGKSARNGQRKEQAHLSWTGQEAFKQLRKYLKEGRQEHRKGPSKLLYGWVVDQNLPQGEVEIRMRFCHIQGELPATSAKEQREKHAASYLGAVTQGLETKPKGEMTAEQSRLRELRLQPAKSLTKLRERTVDENAALLLILNHDIEVPRPPDFLLQSMDAEAYATFADIFHSIEYPLYAHLAPGQKFGNDLTREFILRLIAVGAEAAPQQLQEILDFISDLSRMELDGERRLLTVTFKGRRTAASWVDWKPPFASRTLTLVDCKAEAEKAKESYETVDMDFYHFKATVRRGVVKATDMHWLMSKKLGPKIQEMKLPDDGECGLNHREWRQPEKLSLPKDLEIHQYPIHEQEGNEQQEPVNVQKQQHEAAEATEGQEEETANAEAQDHTPDKKASDANPPEEDNPTDQEGDVDMKAKDEATSEEATPAEPEVEKDRNETMADPLEAADTSGHMAVQQAQGTPEAQDQEEQRGRSRERGNTPTTPTARASVSPKRKVPQEWDESQNGKDQSRSRSPTKAFRTSEQQRSVSPVKLEGKQRQADSKPSQQQYIHQYLQKREIVGNHSDSDSLTPDEPMGAEADADLTEEKAAAPAAGHKGIITATADRKEAEVVLLKVDQPRNVEGNPNPRDTASMPERCAEQDNIAVDTPDSEDCRIYSVKVPPDKGGPLEKWLQRLTGMIIDETDNGHCGWYAYQVACTNLHLDPKGPQLELIGKVNETKKQVMNGLITTMADEAKLNPKELDTILELSGHQDKLTYTLADKLDVLAGHYVNQRKCTVRNPVAMSQWVGPAHMKAMAR